MSVKRAMLDEHEKFLNSTKDVLEKDQWVKLIYFEDTIRKRMAQGAKNKQQDMISGSLLEVSVKFNLRNSLSVPDTSVMI